MLPTTDFETNVRTFAGSNRDLYGLFFEDVDDPGDDFYNVMLRIPDHQSKFERYMDLAAALRARVVLLCDTEEQAEHYARRVARLLPHHRRVALSRYLPGGTIHWV
jgi:hypothetical protein